MSFNNYLFNLANISNEIGYSLAYGHGNIAVTEINSLKALIAKSEEMIPVLEAEACIMEAEEVDREEQSFNYWMTMLYGNDSVSSVDIHDTNKANRLKRRKQNKKHHKADRKHGKFVSQSDKKDWDKESGTFYRWDEKKKTFHSHKKPVVHRNRKTFRNRLEIAMNTREQEYADLFTEYGEILSHVYEMKEDLAQLEEEISVLKEEKKWGYLTEKGVDILEEYKEDALQLENHIKAYKVFCNTAIR